MDWKAEHPKARYIDDLTDEECHHLAYLSQGKPKFSFEVTKIVRTCNGNNIPHVQVHYNYFEVTVGEDIDYFMGIFENLNVYHGSNFMATYCQKEIFEYFRQIGME